MEAIFARPDLLRYMRHFRLAVLSTVAVDGAPQGALVGIAVSQAAEIVFGTHSVSRKHVNMDCEARVALTFAGPGEQTLQLEVRTRYSDFDRNPLISEFFWGPDTEI